MDFACRPNTLPCQKRATGRLPQPGRHASKGFTMSNSLPRIRHPRASGGWLDATTAPHWGRGRFNHLTQCRGLSRCNPTPPVYALRQRVRVQVQGAKRLPNIVTVVHPQRYYQPGRQVVPIHITTASSASIHTLAPHARGLSGE